MSANTDYSLFGEYTITISSSLLIDTIDMNTYLVVQEEVPSDQDLIINFRIIPCQVLSIDEDPAHIIPDIVYSLGSPLTANEQDIYLNFVQGNTDPSDPTYCGSYIYPF